MFRDMLMLAGAAPPSLADERGWKPFLDVYKVRNGWLVKVDLAGVCPNEVSVCLTGRLVTIRGIRRDLCIEEGCCQYRMEISYSRFERSVELPCELGIAAISTEYRDGMLLIRIQCEGCPNE